MYRQPFGDSFLLTFNGASQPYHILIDCGVLHGVPRETKWAQDIARDIYGATSGRLDAIAITHLHWDHVSGFSDAIETFSKFKVDEVWLPWTENAADAGALHYQRLRARQLEAVRGAHSRVVDERNAQSWTALANQLDQILKFWGPDRDEARGLDAARSALLRFTKTPRFLEQGMLVAAAGLPDVRVHVLGPARDDSLLGLSRYASDRGFYSALLALFGDRENAAAEIEAAQPFDVRQRWIAEWRRENPLLRALIDGYEDPDQSWRRIDEAWLFYVAEIGDHLNATGDDLSLALAFELTGSGEVLLFPGDGRLDLRQTSEWNVHENAAAQVRGRDLLARTVFYKVPNHVSHATADDEGLAGMTHPNLVAALTADSDVVRLIGLDAPTASVQARWLQKTQGRLLTPQGIEVLGIRTGTPPSNQSFLDRTTMTPLYIDLIIP